MGAQILSRRPLRGLLAVALAAVAFGCRPEITGPGTPEEGALRIHPVLVSALDPDLFDLDSVEVVIRRAADGAPVKEAVLAYERDAILAWVLGLESLPDVLDVQARVRTGFTPMFEGAEHGIDIVAGSPATAGTVYDVMLQFVGPGHDAAAIAVEPADALVGFGQIVHFNAVVTDAAGEVIPDAFLAWESSDPGLAPVDAQGTLTAPGSRGSVDVTARAGNGVSGSTQITFQPAASQLIVLEGEGVTAPVGGTVPVTVKVLGTDGLGVADVDVTFDASVGASVSAASVTSGPDGAAHTEVTLGTLPGSYVVTASVAGPAPLPVHLTAVPGSPAALEVDLNGSVALAGEALEPGVTVTALDEFGNVTPAAIDISLALGNNPVGAVLSGTTSVMSSGGAAEFTNLVVDRSGSGFTLVASAAGLPSSVSLPFAVGQGLESIEVTPGARLLTAIAATEPFVAVARDAAGHVIQGETFQWASTDETVATVDAGGTVTAVGNGTAEIHATSSGVTGVASIEVAQEADHVIVTPPSGRLAALASQVQIAASVVDANGFPVPDQSVTWTSSASGLVSVDETGLATAEANGVAEIEATSGVVSGSATVTVQQLATAVEVSPGAGAFSALQDQIQLTANAVDANGFTVAGAVFVWTSDADAVAEVDGAGLVTAIGHGGTTIRATADGVTGTAHVDVAQVVASVAVDPPVSTLTALQAQVQLSAGAFDANGFAVAGATFLWSSDAAGVASVGGAGLVTAESNGSATITVEADGTSGAAEVTVAQQPFSMTVSPATATLTALEQTVALGASVVDANGFAVPGQTVTWSVPVDTAATVDATGTVTAVSNGQASVTATSGVLSAAATITVAQQVATLDLEVSCVDPAPPVPVGGPALVVPPPAVSCDTLTAFGDQALVSAEARDANGFVVAHAEIAWASLAPQFAPVDESGLVTAIDNGTAVIRADVDGVAAQLEIVVRQQAVSLTVEPSAVTLGIGEQTQLTALALDANDFQVADADILWTSFDETKVTVSDTGLVTAIAPCETYVVANHLGLAAHTVVTVE